MSDCVAVYMLDVGQGDCTIVLSPDNGVVVFDCADDHVLHQTLAGWGLPRISAFVLSHLDQDHIAGALQLLRGYPQPIDRVYLDTDRDVSSEHDEAQRAKELLDYAADQSREKSDLPRRWELVSNARHPCPLMSGEGWSVMLVAPLHGQRVRREREGRWEDANRYSSILRVQVGPNAMLIGADAPLLSWSELPAAELGAAVFRIPHHGGALDDGGIPEGWSVERLYREVGAETALISVGTNNGHGHPRQEWIEPITGGKCRLLCTQATARCHAPFEIVGSDGRRVRDAVEIEAQRKRVITGHRHWTEPQYRHLTDRRRQRVQRLPEVPCAGTVIVKLHLDGSVAVLPPRGGDHERVIDDWRSPLCRPPEL